MTKTLLSAAVLVFGAQSIAIADEIKAPSMECSYKLNETIKTVRNRRGKIIKRIKGEVVRKFTIILNDDDKAALSALAKNDNCEALTKKDKKGDTVAITDVNGKALKGCSLEVTAQMDYFRRINNRKNRTLPLGEKDLVLSQEMRAMQLILNADNQVVGINLDESAQTNGKQDSLKTATKLSKKGSKLEFQIDGRKGRSKNACTALELIEQDADADQGSDQDNTGADQGNSGDVVVEEPLD